MGFGSARTGQRDASALYTEGHCEDDSDVNGENNGVIIPYLALSTLEVIGRAYESLLADEGQRARVLPHTADTHC